MFKIYIIIMATKLQIMEHNIGLTRTVDISTNTTNTTRFLVDYSKLQNNFIINKTNRGTPTSPIFGTNEDWQLVGVSGETIGNIGHMFRSRIEEAVGAPLPDNERLELDKVVVKINNRINEILNEHDGIDNIFRYKSQYVKADGSKLCEGGPTAFFRYLFDFVIPSKVSIRNDILELPTAGTANGQCFKVYPNGGFLQYKPPRWATGEGMSCYICDFPLTI